METTVLKNTTEEGIPLEATFATSRGMNLLSFKKGDVEFIDQSTYRRFQETGDGLGALIGPHYENRHPGIIPKMSATVPWWPHAGKLKDQGLHDPFYQGVARYAPWEPTIAEPTLIKARLSGKQAWQGQPLAALEGQNFTMDFRAILTKKGLEIDYSVISDSDSMVGLDYHFRLPEGPNYVISDVQDYYLENKDVVTIPSTWKYDENRYLHFDLQRPANFTFHPFRDPLQGHIVLETPEYRMLVDYRSQSQENSWQLVRRQAESCVSIRPLSAKLPYRPSLTVSGLSVKLTPCDL